MAEKRIKDDSKKQGEQSVSIVMRYKVVANCRHEGENTSWPDGSGLLTVGRAHAVSTHAAIYNLQNTLQ